jgi:hypothetical protein
VVASGYNFIRTAGSASCNEDKDVVDYHTNLDNQANSNYKYNGGIPKIQRRNEQYS